MSRMSVDPGVGSRTLRGDNLRLLVDRPEGGERGAKVSITAEPHETGDERATRRLWLSVIVQTFRDALLVEASAYDKKRKWCSIASTSPSNIPLVRSRARTWLLETTGDFADVCGFAGLDPDVVRDAARRVLGSAANIRAARRIFFSASPAEGEVMRYLRNGSKLRD